MISVNSRAVKLAKKLVSDPEGYKVKVHNVLGANVIDCGWKCQVAGEQLN